eukprot:PhF_6_TR10185/c0_g1_i1/m.15796/K11254/H4; histone H4
MTKSPTVSPRLAPQSTSSAKGVSLKKSAGAKKSTTTTNQNKRARPASPSATSITNPCIQRIARRAGIKRVSSLIYDEVRRFIKDRLHMYLADAITCCEMRKATTVQVQDVLYAMRRRGQTVYGF